VAFTSADEFEPPIEITDEGNGRYRITLPGLVRLTPEGNPDPNPIFIRVELGQNGNPTTVSIVDGNGRDALIGATYQDQFIYPPRMSDDGMNIEIRLLPPPPTCPPGIGTCQSPDPEQAYQSSPVLISIPLSALTDGPQAGALTSIIEELPYPTPEPASVPVAPVTPADPVGVVTDTALSGPLALAASLVPSPTQEVSTETTNTATEPSNTVTFEDGTLPVAEVTVALTEVAAPVTFSGLSGMGTGLVELVSATAQEGTATMSEMTPSLAETMPVEGALAW
jgi:hypothetical protein